MRNLFTSVLLFTLVSVGMSATGWAFTRSYEGPPNCSQLITEGPVSPGDMRSSVNQHAQSIAAKLGFNCEQQIVQTVGGYRYTFGRYGAPHPKDTATLDNISVYYFPLKQKEGALVSRISRIGRSLAESGGGFGLLSTNENFICYTTSMPGAVGTAYAASCAFRYDKKNGMEVMRQSSIALSEADMDLFMREVAVFAGF